MRIEYFVVRVAHYRAVLLFADEVDIVLVAKIDNLLVNAGAHNNVDTLLAVIRHGVNRALHSVEVTRAIGADDDCAGINS